MVGLVGRKPRCADVHRGYGKTGLVPRSGLFLALLLECAPALLQAAGTTAADFLRFGVGAPAGMSEASGSVAQGMDALYWNPAGLAAADRSEAYLSHAGLPQTLTNDFFGLAFPAGLGPGNALGYSLQVLSQGAMDRLDNQGNPAGAFSASDMAHTLVWARQIGAERVGASLRYIRQTIESSSGGSLALGLGAQRDFGPWSAGVSVNNFGPDLGIGEENFPLPLTVRVGGSFTAIEGELFLAADGSLERGRGGRLHGGVEYRVYPPWEVYSGYNTTLVAVRLGAAVGDQNADGPSGFSIGGSVAWKRFRADVSYQLFGALGDLTQLGFGYGF